MCKNPERKITGFLKVDELELASILRHFMQQNDIDLKEKKRSNKSDTIDVTCRALLLEARVTQFEALFLENDYLIRTDPVKAQWGKLDLALRDLISEIGMIRLGLTLLQRKKML